MMVDRVLARHPKISGGVTDEDFDDLFAKIIIAEIVNWLWLLPRLI